MARFHHSMKCYGYTTAHQAYKPHRLRILYGAYLVQSTASFDAIYVTAHLLIKPTYLSCNSLEVQLSGGN